MTQLLEIENLKVTFDTTIERVLAIDNISLTLNRGEIVGIIGNSGSGKSTIARVILGLYHPNQTNEGKVLLNNQTSVNVLEMNPLELMELRRQELSIIFQNPLLSLNPSKRIRKQLIDVSKLYNNGFTKQALNDALDKVGLLDEAPKILNAYPHQLSGGQQQRIVIALSLLSSKPLLIMDEPMSSLDQANKEALIKLLKDLVIDENMSILLISHDLSLVEALANRIYVIDNGQIVESGNTDELLKNPQNLHTRNLVDANVLDSNSLKLPISTPVIRLEHVSKIYRSGNMWINRSGHHVQALEDVSFTISRGSILGIVGASGSGKSTIAKVIAGEIESTSGETFFNQMNTRSEKWKKIRHKKLQIIAQNADDAMNPRMLIGDQLKLVLDTHFPNKHPEEKDKIIVTLMSDLGLEPPLRNRYSSELSGGQIQRFSIVRALLIRPEVLILDESLSSLDTIVQKQILDILLRLNQTLRLTIILISHDIRVVEYLCNEIIELESGKIAAQRKV